MERNGVKGWDTTDTTDTTGSTSSTNAGIFFQGNGTYTSTVEKGAEVTIKDNAGCGIYTKQSVCNLTLLSGVITNNGTGKVNTSGDGANYGGGVYNIGTMVLGSDVVLYNNHAGTAGDDIYNTGTISFGPVGDDWCLDGDPDCYDPIDGWYDDAENNRWEAHAEDESERHIVLVSPPVGYAAKGLLALKAAHGYIEPAPIVPEW